MTKDDSQTQDSETLPASRVEKSTTVVGIGASAGGLTALKRLFELMPSDSDLAFVVVVHLSPEHKSHLPDLLQPSVRFPVRQVTETVPLEPNHVYVIPPNANLSAIDTHLRLSKLEEQRRERAPIDHFFRTLAASHDGHSIGVILTGTGSDGTLGLREIKAKGGLILVQDPNEAEFDGMPQSAIATGLVDRILSIEEMPQALVRLAEIGPRIELAGADKNSTEHNGALLPKVLAILRTRTERDFSRYKSATLLRRIARRMQLNYLDNFAEYIDKLREQPEEARALSDDLLITVTSFFRDPDAFQKLEQYIIPELFEGKGPTDTIRVWSVGCATGEEAYSIAMLLLEEAARRESPPKIQIFASDIHKRSLDGAREGVYAGDIETDVSDERLKRFFRKENGGYRIQKEVREIVTFAPHNLLGDPPFSRLHLITCRNLLIYLDRAVQRDVIDLFHYALCPNGYLLLGSAETIDTSELFRTEDKKLCFYKKRNVPPPEPRLPVFPLMGTRASNSPGTREETRSGSVVYHSVHQNLLERYAPPSILIAPDNRLSHLSEQAGRYLVLPGGDVTLSAVKLVREELRIELQGLLQSARETKQFLDSRAILVRFNGQPVPVVMHVRPAQDSDQEGFVLVIFEEHQASAEKPRSDRSQEQTAVSEAGEASTRIAELEAELSAGYQRLQATIEEYETSQEEMKASGEEMQSTNEELRSTLEELETSKEELQSINEELQTVNQENRHKVEELSQLSSDIQNLLTSTEIATLFLDRELRIMRFTPRLSELFNIRVADRGRPISDLTHRLGYGELREDAQTVLARLVPIEREIRDEAARWYLTRVLPYRSMEDRIEGVVITFVEITDRKLAEERLQESEALRRVALAGGRMGTWRWDLNAQLIWGDPQFWRIWGVTPSDDPRPLSFFNDRMSPASVAAVAEIVTTAVEKGEEFDGPLEVVSGPTAGHWLRWRGRAGVDDKTVLYGVTFDITGQKQAENHLQESETRQAFLLKLSDALRPLSDGDTIQQEAMRVLGTHLHVTRAQYYQADETGEYLDSAGGYAEGVAPVTQRVRMDDFGPYVREAFSAGRVLAVADVSQDPRVSKAELASYDALGFRAFVGIPLVKAGQLRGTLGLHHFERREWTEAEIQLAEETADRTWAAVERARAETARLEAEEKFRLFVENVQEYALVQTDIGGAISSWNPGAERLFGYSAEEMLRRNFAVLLTSEDAQSGLFDQELAVVASGKRNEDARWFVRKDGSRFWARWISEPILDSTGRFLGMAKIMRDETKRAQAEAFTKESLAEKEELLKEVHHRVKNNLQVITSLLNLQARQIKEPAMLALFEESKNRVQSIASIHELLYRAESFATINLADYARRVVPGLVLFYGFKEGVETEISGDTASLELERAVPYGLLLNELVSNACKHAFASGRCGKLSVHFEHRGSDIALTVADNGPGLPAGFDPHRTNSLGLHLVRNLTRQLHGTFEMTSEGGTTVRVRFPDSEAFAQVPNS